MHRPFLLSLILLLTLLHHLPLHTFARIDDTITFTSDTRTTVHLSSFGYDSNGVFELDLTDYTLDHIASTADTQLPVKDEYEVAFILQRSRSDLPTRISSETTVNAETKQIFARVTSYADSGTSGNTTSKDNNAAVIAPNLVTMSSFSIVKDCYHLSLIATEQARVTQQLSSNSETEFFLIPLPLRSYGSFHKQINITTPGFYHTYFSNCEPGSRVSIQKMYTVQYNVNTDGTHMYLSTGERYLPGILIGLCCAFIALSMVWISFLLSKREYVKAIHYLMLGCLLLKSAQLFLDSMKLHTLKSTGQHDSWWVLSYIVTGLKTVWMFVVLMLLTTGWSYLKPFLTLRDQRILGATIALQGLINILNILAQEIPAASASYPMLINILAIADFVGWLFMLLPIIWSIRSLRENVTEELRRSEDSQVRRSMSRLKSFRSFFLLVIGFIYMRVLIVWLLIYSLSFDLMWIATVFSEVAALIFYSGTGWLFRPKSANEYEVIEMEDETDIPSAGTMRERSNTLRQLEMEGVDGDDVLDREEDEERNFGMKLQKEIQAELESAET